MHPRIVASLPPDACIADVGTATGTYLVELDQSLPDTAAYTYHGFDSSASLFRNNLPQKVSLHVHDVRHEFPAQFHGKFDAIHLRLLVGGMGEDDWEVAVRNLLALLKPGGAIQWEEADFMQSQYRRAGGREAIDSTVSIGKLLDGIRYGMQHRFEHGFCDLPDIYRKLGMERVEADMVSSDRVAEVRKPLVVTAAAAAEAWIRYAKYWPEEEIDRVVKDAARDVDMGAYSRYDIFASIGFKPNSSDA